VWGVGHHHFCDDDARKFSNEIPSPTELCRAVLLPAFGCHEPTPSVHCVHVVVWSHPTISDFLGSREMPLTKTCHIQLLNEMPSLTELCRAVLLPAFGCHEPTPSVDCVHVVVWSHPTISDFLGSCEMPLMKTCHIQLLNEMPSLTELCCPVLLPASGGHASMGCVRLVVWNRQTMSDFLGSREMPSMTTRRI